MDGDGSSFDILGNPITTTEEYPESIAHEEVAQVLGVLADRASEEISNGREEHHLNIWSRIVAWWRSRMPVLFGGVVTGLTSSALISMLGNGNEQYTQELEFLRRSFVRSSALITLTRNRRPAILGLIANRRTRGNAPETIRAEVNARVALCSMHLQCCLALLRLGDSAEEEIHLDQYEEQG
ncbi:MAG: hypothetical protein M4579_003525 [Chaenotheca gracillima]|nr:MAG: hypothetical protein M4579_003525 [Chaenotheca gracillima]